MTQNDTPLYPLRFEPIYKEKVWGGRTLEKLGRTLPGDEKTPIGESWELADLSQTSPSGGGGDSEHSVVANGPLAGDTIPDLLKKVGHERLLGRLRLSEQGGFPLLVKFLDAKQNLSVQVHPSAEYADRHPDAFLKSEAWYILDSEPGAAIYKGVRDGVTPEQFREAIENDSVEPLMIRVPVKPGDCHYLPSGTCHALGAGVLVAEVQTPSDTTFRVYDWGRTGRELHVDQAIQCIHFGPPDVRQYEKRSHIAGIHTTVTRLVTCEHFRIEKVRMNQGYHQELPYDQPAVWMVLEGAATITTADAPPTQISPAETYLVPAGLNDAKAEFTQDTTWLEITFPQAMPEQLA